MTAWAGEAGTDVGKLAGLKSSGLRFTRSGGDLLVQVNSTGETLKIERQFIDTNGIDQLVFADNSTWDRSQIQTAAWIRGTAAGETINGSAAADVIDGRGGNDQLNGG